MLITKQLYFLRIKRDIENRISKCSPLQETTHDELKISWLVEKVEELENKLEKTKKDYNDRIDSILKKLLDITNNWKQYEGR